MVIKMRLITYQSEQVLQILKSGLEYRAKPNMRMKKEYDMRRRLIVNSLNDMGLTCFEPEGAFYVFPSVKSTGLSSMEFSEKLIYSKHVAVVPGTAFGDCGEGFLRISYSYSINHITEAMARIEQFLKEIH